VKNISERVRYFNAALDERLKEAKRKEAKRKEAKRNRSRLADETKRPSKAFGAFEKNISERVRYFNAALKEKQKQKSGVF